MNLTIDRPAPEFELPADDGGWFNLTQMLGQRTLLVFYPGDDTPVCTRQLCDYRDGIEAFAGFGVRVIGISRNNSASHRKFREKYRLPFTLLTDQEGKVAERYGAWGLFGMKRAVFLIDETGLLRYAKVETLSLFRRHRAELLEVIKNLDDPGAL